MRFRLRFADKAVGNSGFTDPGAKVTRAEPRYDFLLINHGWHSETGLPAVSVRCRINNRLPTYVKIHQSCRHSQVSSRPLPAVFWTFWKKKSFSGRNTQFRRFVPGKIKIIGCFENRICNITYSVEYSMRYKIDKKKKLTHKLRLNKYTNRKKNGLKTFSEEVDV